MAVKTDKKLSVEFIKRFKYIIAVRNETNPKGKLVSS